MSLSFHKNTFWRILGFILYIVFSAIFYFSLWNKNYVISLDIFNLKKADIVSNLKDLLENIKFCAKICFEFCKKSIKNLDCKKACQYINAKIDAKIVEKII